MRYLLPAALLCLGALASSSHPPACPGPRREVWRQPGLRLQMQLPPGYRRQFASGGEAARENDFVYPDSAAVYVTDFAGGSSLNYPSIARLGPATLARRFASRLLQPSRPLTDTLVLQGRTLTGRYWKDVRVGELSIGYANVSASQQACFEAALASFQKK